MKPLREFFSKRRSAASPKPAPSEPTPHAKHGAASATSQTNPAAPGRDSVATLLLRVKKPRYAHMGKHHELREEFTDADNNYMLLVEAQSQTLGDAHPDFATALYELAKLNHLHKIEHRPDVEIIYNTLGRATQVKMFYTTALQVRQNALGPQHPAYAQSLYGLARLHKDSKMFEEALSMLEQAQRIYDGTENPLPAAQCASCIAEIYCELRDFLAATTACHTAQRSLGFPCRALPELARAEESCNQLNTGPTDAPNAGDSVKQARAIQTPFVDPFYKMAFDLLEGSDDLMAMMLDLHRQQYRRDLVATLNAIAAIHQTTGNISAAIPLYEQVAEIQRKDPLCRKVSTG